MAPELPVRSKAGGGLRRMVVAVALCLLVLVGLATWALLVPVTVDPAGRHDGGGALRCDVIDPDGGAGLRLEVEQRCDDAEATRRNTALVAGGIAVTVAFAVSTWPSRRLTGEELGPLR